MTSETYNNIQGPVVSRTVDALFNPTDSGREALFGKVREALQEEMERKVDAGDILKLTDEEIRMLKSFRRFKLRCKAGQVFKWQTRPDGDVIVSEDTGLISDPQEVTA